MYIREARKTLQALLFNFFLFCGVTFHRSSIGNSLYRIERPLYYNTEDAMYSRNAITHRHVSYQLSTDYISFQTNDLVQ